VTAGRVLVGVGDAVAVAVGDNVRVGRDVRVTDGVALGRAVWLAVGVGVSGGRGAEGGAVGVTKVRVAAAVWLGGKGVIVALGTDVVKVTLPVLASVACGSFVCSKGRVADGSRAACVGEELATEL
jgi:hypothetical protein